MQQAHIHLGQRGVTGGISAFLCTNLPNRPGAPACPPPPATVEGRLTAADVIGPAVQGITAGEFDELVAAIRAGATYVNVHSDKWSGGEIRSQLGRDNSGRVATTAERSRCVPGRPRSPRHGAHSSASQT